MPAKALRIRTSTGYGCCSADLFYQENKISVRLKKTSAWVKPAGRKPQGQPAFFRSLKKSVDRTLPAAARSKFFQLSARGDVNDSDAGSLSAIAEHFPADLLHELIVERARLIPFNGDAETV